jgi:Ca2+-binding RTX toxin-like protein
MDTVSYAARTAGVDVSKDRARNDGGPDERDDVQGDVETVVGGSARDVLQGGPAPDILVGGPGDDVIAGHEGDDDLSGDDALAAGTDTIDGGGGDDRIHGEAGGDALAGGAGADMVDGGTSDDRLEGGPGPDRLVGGEDRDLVVYGAEADVTVRLQQGEGLEQGERDHLVQVEDVSGGGGSDSLTGTGTANRLAGGVGDDYVDGRRGVDRLDGGEGSDVVASRDRTRDEPVSCGPGEDLAIVDRLDRAVRRGPNACEQVSDDVRTTPRPGLVYVHPRCTGTTDGVGLRLAAMPPDRRVPLRYSVLLQSGFRDREAPSLDISDCPVRLTASTVGTRRASADVSGGAVDVGQTSGHRVTTLLTLRSPPCSIAARARRATARRPRLRVATRRRPGRWKVRGRFSSAASVGTDWTTVDGCSSTTTIVHHGRVRVFDRGTKRTYVVPAGGRHVARGRTTP